MIVWHPLGVFGGNGGHSPDCPSTQESCRVAVVCDMVPVVADLSIPELFGKVQADQVGTVQVRDGLRLMHGRGDKDFVTHVVCLTVPVL